MLNEVSDAYCYFKIYLLKKNMSVKNHVDMDK